MGAATPATTTAEDSSRQGSQVEGEEECGWCRWMKAGGCKEPFEVWQKCVDGVREAGRDDVETCASVMGPLWECMERHAEYYAPQVDALKSSRDKAAQAAAADVGADAAATGEHLSSPSSASKQQPESSSRATSASNVAIARQSAAGRSGGKLDPDAISEQDVERWLQELDREDAGTASR